MMRALGLIALAVCGAAPSAHGEQEPRPPTPSQIELVGDLGLPRTTWSLWFGGRHWWRDRFMIAARIGVTQTIKSDDYDGDNDPDFSPSDFGPHFEAQLDLGLPLLLRERFSLLHWISSVSVRNRGRTQSILKETVEVRETRELSLVTGARIALDSNAQVAIPIGLRYTKKEIVGGSPGLFKSKHAQARLLVVAPAATVGVDAELVWWPKAQLIRLFFEFIPALGDETYRDENPSYNSFYTAPSEARLLFGVRMAPSLEY